MTLESSKLQILWGFVCVNLQCKSTTFLYLILWFFFFCIAYQKRTLEHLQSVNVGKQLAVQWFSLLFKFLCLALLEKGILLLQSVLNWVIIFVSLWRNPILTLLILGTSLCAPDIVPVSLFHHWGWSIWRTYLQRSWEIRLHRLDAVWQAAADLHLLCTDVLPFPTQ